MDKGELPAQLTTQKGSKDEYSSHLKGLFHLRIGSKSRQRRIPLIYRKMLGKKQILSTAFPPK